MTKLTNFVFRSSLALIAIFGIVTVAGAETAEVNDFDGLQNAINYSNKNNIDIKQNIPFTNEIVINRSDLTISGPGGGKSN
ncbi:MAG: hypothetical protein LBB13_02890 [Rickettsiales bacterium]|nr:hypothetical protein [Rickettsiales bacterium]